MRHVTLLLACAVALAACGGDSSPSAPPPSLSKEPARAPEPQPKPSHCPRSAGNCRTASGRILYVEAVDPDGDGDAHFVLTGSNGVTGPGISVIDVEKGMRPKPLPRVGDLVSAAGPVYRGSHGQRQIQATELHVARAPRR
jgi:hypothetical protein